MDFEGAFATTPQPDSGRERRMDARDKHPRLNQACSTPPRAHGKPPRCTLKDVPVRPSYMRKLPRNGRHAKSAWTKEREPKLWEHQRGHGWSRKGHRTHTPCGCAAQRLTGARALQRCLLICHLGQREIRESLKARVRLGGKAAQSEKPGPNVLTKLFNGSLVPLYYSLAVIRIHTRIVAPSNADLFATPHRALTQTHCGISK